MSSLLLWRTRWRGSSVHRQGAFAVIAAGRRIPRRGQQLGHIQFSWCGYRSDADVDFLIQLGLPMISFGESIMDAGL